MTIAVVSANPSEVQQALDVISSAFSADPIWSWAFPDLAARRRFMNLYIHEALRFPCVFRTAGFESVAVWIPPGEEEFSKEQEAGIPALLAELAGTRAADVAELLRLFGEAHPHTEPHYYLSLLGVDSEHRGRGLGMALLKENLTRVDAQRMPAYLESTNPANDQRYQSLGFRPVSSFRAPRNGPTATGMWREKR